MLIYGVIIASLLFNAEWSIAQSSPQKKPHADETLPLLEVTATRSKKGIINVPAALSKTSIQYVSILDAIFLSTKCPQEIFIARPLKLLTFITSFFSPLSCADRQSNTQRIKSGEVS